MFKTFYFQEAIKKLRKHRDQFTALVTSIMMSGASGVENVSDFISFVYVFN